MAKSEILFNSRGKDVTFEDILKKIWENSEDKQAKIQQTADHLKDKINNLQDAVIIMPSLIQLQDTAIKNDDAIVKMAAIVQRMKSKIKSKDAEDTFGFSAMEREQLLQAVREASMPGAS